MTLDEIEAFQGVQEEAETTVRLLELFQQGVQKQSKTRVFAEVPKLTMIDSACHSAEAVNG